MSRDVKREAAFVSAFVVKERRERALADLASKNHRGAFFDRLRREHAALFDRTALEPVPPANSYPPDLFLLLREQGAPKTCYVLSTVAELDGREVGLLEALERVVGSGQPSVLCCVPGTLALFETDPEPGTPPRYLLAHPKGR